MPESQLSCFFCLDMIRESCPRQKHETSTPYDTYHILKQQPYLCASGEWQRKVR